MPAIVCVMLEDNLHKYFIILNIKMECKEYIDCITPSQANNLQTTSLYPNLNTLTATAPEGEIHIVEGTAHSYRLRKISEIQQEIEREREKRAMLSKKYHRAVKAINAVDDTLVVATVGLGVAGTVLLSTVIAAPIVIGMEAGAIGAALLSIVGNYYTKILSMKGEKHEKIKTLADAKLNTISDHISKALKDDIVSDEEYALILSELEKFNAMKEEIRSKIKVGIDEQTKQSLINQGREETLKSFQSMFGKSRESFRRKLNIHNE
jgi:hypothetical protein